MAQKYYAVAKGREGANIYLSWDECKANVFGFSGAVYKSFGDLADAKAFISDNSGKVKVSGKELIAYVDGSYSIAKKMYSYGVVFLKSGKVVHTISRKGSDSEAAEMRQIYGELMGAMKAVDYAISEGEKSIVIHYDYMGIENWALGNWKRNKKHTQKYYDFMQDRLKKIDVKFVKVLAHSGDEFNDMADSLAKRALK